VNSILAEQIPRNYIRRWRREFATLRRGDICGLSGGGFPVTLYDGSYHDWIERLVVPGAGRIGVPAKPWKWRADAAGAVMAVTITAPDEFAGNIMGPEFRRGRIPGHDNKGGNTIVRAEVPDGGNADLPAWT